MGSGWPSAGERVNDSGDAASARWAEVLDAVPDGKARESQGQVDRGVQVQLAELVVGAVAGDEDRLMGATRDITGVGALEGPGFGVGVRGCSWLFSVRVGDWWRRLALAVGGTGGVAVSTPVSPAEMLEADFRPRAGAKCLGASWLRAENAVGAARAKREPPARAAGAQNGRARRALVDAVGVRGAT
jgi:hypothetical protein